MRPTNVLIIHTDQQRYDSLGCTGSRFARTPNLDALAAQGTIFDRHIAANTICMPSRASLLTGLYPPGHHVWCNGVALNRRDYLPALREPNEPALTPEPPTIADLFAAAGYDTAAFGKLHLTPYLAPAEHGFQESDALWRTGALDDWRGPYYGFRHVELTLHHGGGCARAGHYGAWLRREHPAALPLAQERNPLSPQIADLGPSGLPYELTPTHWLGERFRAWLGGRVGHERPFLAWVGFPDPHHPFRPAADIWPMFREAEVESPVDPDGECWRSSPTPKVSQCRIAGLAEEDIRMVRRATHAMNYQIDLAVGRMLAAVREAGLWEETVIVFTSDHGDFLGDHGLLRKGWGACDALLRVPFLLRAPRGELPRRAATPMSNCDVLPTLAALAGVALPSWMHGRDILPALRAGGPSPVFAYNWDGKPETANYTVYDERCRYTCYPARGCEELYDHAADPGECRDLSGAPAQRERAAALRRIVADAFLVHANPILARFGKW